MKQKMVRFSEDIDDEIKKINPNPLNKNPMNIFPFSFIMKNNCEEVMFFAKNVSSSEFEKDLQEAKNFAEELSGKKIVQQKWDMFGFLGKGYFNECLGEYFEQIAWYLQEKKGYISCQIKDNLTYVIRTENTEERKEEKIIIEKKLTSVMNRVLF
ncbi:MAG: hypothetical protein WC781_05410 [Candidatus Pacearchaeota archaeon]|jgi:hypothetical protein